MLFKCPWALRSAYSSLSSPVNEVKANAVLIVKAQLVQLCKTQLEEFKAWQFKFPKEHIWIILERQVLKLLKTHKTRHLGP